MEQQDIKLVSVVVQAYHSSGTVIRTLESIKAQDYPRIELIVTDDASKDDTVAVARKWMEENKDAFVRTRLITSDVNTGIPGSNNRALKHVQGEYAEFLAADDFMMPDAVSVYVAYCEKHPGVIPVARVRLFSDDVGCDFTSVEKYCENCYAFAAQRRKEQYRQLLVQNRIVAPAAAFYPVGILRELRGFDERYRWMEDYPVNLKILKNGYRFGFLDRELIGYRISGGSVTGANRTPLKLTEARLFFYEKMWYMIGNKMAWEALKQSKSWLKVILRKGK